ncbi:hypothetical protein CPB86DRAFT_698397 [Serendipita vermifera]|nr:hypothetical protein CPB86DRAFT_698397 [Serendipita vermifera]
MATEVELNTLVPESLQIPPPLGNSPIWKLSSEVFLMIAEYLDTATCLTLSQTCRTLYQLSIDRSIYWRSAKLVHGLLPRVAPLSTFSGKELRETAIKSTNLEWKWEDPSPRLVRRVPIPILYRKERYFIPPGSRWLFQYGFKTSSDQTRWVSVYDLITETVVGSWCLEVTEGYPIFSGESVEPNLVILTMYLHESSKVGLYAAHFTQSQTGEVSVKFEKQGEIVFKNAVRFCTLEEGVIAAGNPFEVLVERWGAPNSRRHLNFGAEWLQAGVQIAKNRLITLEGTGVQDENRMWRINVFDISSVRNAQADQVLNDHPLYSIASASLPNAPCAPFYAPYWEDRVDQAGIHFGFKTMLRMHTSIGECLWHCDFRLDNQLVSGEIQEVLTVEEPNIIGEVPDQRPTQFTNGYVLGPKASRIVWTGQDGLVRIRSEWTEENPWASRLLDLKWRPMSIPSLYAFDERLGIVLLSDTLTHLALFWFI